jgi:hypothetical protein
MCPHVVINVERCGQRLWSGSVPAIALWPEKEHENPLDRQSLGRYLNPGLLNMKQ